MASLELRVPEGLSGFFRGADELRRRQGSMLERLGFGPQTTPSRTVRSYRAAELIAYQPPRARASAILIVPAPIKTAYIWDLAPGSSVIERLLSAGLDVYLIAWQRPQPGDESLGLLEYADQTIAGALDAVAAETGQAKAFLAGHSLGGTLAAIFASLYPQRVRGLIALEAPMEFGSGMLEAVVATAPHAHAITDGNVPGTFLNWASVYADPLTFNVEPMLDLALSTAWAPANRLHWQVRRWTLDEAAMPRRLFEEVVEELYRNNRFAEGRLRVGARLAAPRAIEAPILGVLNPQSRIVPRSAVEAYRIRTGSSDVQILNYSGDTGVVLEHVGVLVGPSAHRFLWPRIVRWIKTQDLP